jgi:hypothetical protein
MLCPVHILLPCTFSKRIAKLAHFQLSLFDLFLEEHRAFLFRAQDHVRLRKCMSGNGGHEPHPPLYLRLIESVLKISLSDLRLSVVHCHKFLTMLLVFAQLDTFNVNMPHCLVENGRVRRRARVGVRVRVRVKEWGRHLLRSRFHLGHVVSCNL